MLTGILIILSYVVGFVMGIVAGFILKKNLHDMSVAILNEYGDEVKKNGQVEEIGKAEILPPSTEIQRKREAIIMENESYGRDTSLSEIMEDEHED